MSVPSDHLLRTLAAVPSGNAILELGGRSGRHTLPLLQLGFDVYVCDGDEQTVSSIRERVSEHLGPAEANRRVTYAPHGASLSYPDGYFDWVIAYDTFDDITSREDLVEALREIRRIIRPGGWLYAGVRAMPLDFNPRIQEAEYASDSGPQFTFTEDTLTEVMQEADLALAEYPSRTMTDHSRLEGIYRRVDPGIPV